MEYARKSDLYEKIILIIKEDVKEGVITGVERLLEKGSILLLEKGNKKKNEEDSPLYHALKSLNRNFLRIEGQELIEIIKIFLNHPDLVETFIELLDKGFWTDLSLFFKTKGLNLESFKSSFILKGLIKRFKEKNISGPKKSSLSFENYLKSMVGLSPELLDFYNSLDMEKSHFFEDPKVYEYLKSKILPQIFKNEKESVRVIVHGCGTGEEALSVALVIYDFIIENGYPHKVTINVRDTNIDLIRNFIQQRLGYRHFPLEGTKNIPKTYHKYLKKGDVQFTLVEDVWKLINFKKYNLFSAPRLVGVDLVFIQNVFPMLNGSMVKKVLETQSLSLKLGGYLITEKTFVLPEELNFSFSKTSDFRNGFKLLKRGDIQSLLKEAIDKQDKNYEIDRDSYQSVMTKSKNFLDELKEELRNVKGTKKDDSEDSNILSNINNSLLKTIQELEGELNTTKEDLKAVRNEFKEVFEYNLNLGNKLKKDKITYNFNKVEKESFDKKSLLMVERVRSLNNIFEEKTEVKTATLKELTLKLDEANKSLKRFEKERNQFFASLSHELRTPLNSILGFSQLLQKYFSIEGNEQKRFADSINFSGKSLLRLVNSIHDFTKIDLGELKLSKKSFNLRDSLDSISLPFKSECELKGLSFGLEIENNTPKWVESDELALKQILDNLLNNALKFTKKGHIKIKIENHNKIDEKEPSGDKSDEFILKLTVSDTGIGLSPDQLESVGTEPFSQFHKNVQFEERGSGLGLYISKKIIKKLDGELLVSSNVGKGSSFTILLPIVPTLKFEQILKTKDVESYDFSGESILIADDIAQNIELYKAYLSTYNLKVRTAKDGNEVIEKVKQYRPQLILTDFSMPRLNADKFLEILRSENINTPVILISALKLDDKVKKKFQSFLQKPVEEVDFINEIGRFLIPSSIPKDEKASDLEILIPEEIAKTDEKTIQSLVEKLEEWKNSMSVSIIEKEAESLEKEFMNKELKTLIPFLQRIKKHAKEFNINLLEKLMDEATEKLEKALKKINS